MSFAMNTFGVGIVIILLALGLMQTTRQRSGDRQPGSPISAPVPHMPTPLLPSSQAAGSSSAMVYIKVVIDKKYRLLARLMGGMQDSTWQRIKYDAANPWWDSPQ